MRKVSLRPWEKHLDTSSQICDTPPIMKTVTVRDLRYDFPKIEAWLELGEEVLVTKRNKLIATITKSRPLSQKALPPLPDFAARRKKIWGDRVFSAQEVEEMRAFESGEP
jgi:antitoxin (DNA-binding transcriptional repressor) of toxin-antitoxin stability system